MEFSYFDQFSDMEIDLTQYLKSLSTKDFKYTLSNTQPIKTTLKNLFTKNDLIIDYKNNIDLIIKYSIVGDEFIETVSYKIYGTVEYWWIVAVFNDIKEPFKDWPLTQKQLLDKVNLLYNTERKYSFETYLNFLTKENDSKRDLILPNLETLKDIIWKYRQVILNA